MIWQITTEKAGKSWTEQISVLRSFNCTQADGKLKNLPELLLDPVIETMWLLAKVRSKLWLELLQF